MDERKRKIRKQSYGKEKEGGREMMLMMMMMMESRGTTT